MAGRPPLDQFDAESEDIESYLERLQEYFTAYDIEDDDDERSYRLQQEVTVFEYWKICRKHFPSWRLSLLLEHFKPTRLKIAGRYRFHSAVQQQRQSIADFVRELKKLAGTCELTNEQLNDNLRDRLICGLRSQHVKQRLLSRNFTFQEAVNEAIAQEAARKEVKDIADSHGGETSFSGDSGGVNEVTRDKWKSRGRFSKRGNCRHKGAECFKCHKTGHLQSDCPNGKFPPRPKKDRQHVRLAEDFEELEPSDSEDGFHAAISTLDSESQDLKISAPAVRVPVRIEDVGLG